MQIRIKKLNALATLPEYAHGPSEDAGLDVRSLEDAVLAPGKFPRATKYNCVPAAAWH
jgi:dUTP pyrophosphatase